MLRNVKPATRKPAGNSTRVDPALSKQSATRRITMSSWCGIASPVQTDEISAIARIPIRRNRLIDENARKLNMLEDVLVRKVDPLFGEMLYSPVCWFV